MGRKDDSVREAWAMAPNEVKPLVLSTVFCPGCGHTAMAEGFAMRMGPVARAGGLLREVRARGVQGRRGPDGGEQARGVGAVGSLD